jgi:hypothetical protein
MNDRIDFERLVNGRFAREHDVRPPDRAVDEILTHVSRARPLPRWLALIKEPSMRYSSSLAVGSPIARVLAILAATLLLVALVTAAGAGAARLLAADDQLVVDASGGGTHTTIADALADSEDGDTILVRPGAYTEAVIIDKDITLTGDGPVDEIVISAPADGAIFGDPEVDSHFYALLVEGSDAAVSNLTLRGERSALVVNGGAPVLSGLVFDHVNNEDRSVDDQRQAVVFTDGSTGTLRDSTFIDSDDLHVSNSAPLIENNTLSGGSSIWGGMENETVIRGNHIDGSMGASIYLQVQTEALIEGNTITDPLEEAGIWVKGDGPPGVLILDGSQNDPEPTIRGNTITVSGDVPGIYLTPRVGGSVTDNIIEVEDIGILVERGGTTHISGNTICAGVTAFEVEEPNEIDVSDNEICEDAPME